MVRIAVASGKGGTGKTMVSLALAETISRMDQGSILISDCDVEAPNAHLFLEIDFEEQKDVELMIPRIADEKCTGCGKCGEVCQYNALIVLKGKPVVFPSLCHGCGSCTLICPDQAIDETPYPIGSLQRGAGNRGIKLRQGALFPGEPLAVPVISALKDWNGSSPVEWEILDCPPGASCPVVEAVRGADFLLLVTEPTLFGLHDLKQAIEVGKELGIQTGVVINRAGIGNVDIQSYCSEAGIPVYLSIPLDQEIGQGLARGQSLLAIKPAFEGDFNRLLKKIDQTLGEVQ